MSSVTFRDKLYFNFDGIWSSSMDLMSVELDNGMFSETLVGDRNIREMEISGNDEPIFYGIDTSPLEIDLTIAFERHFDECKINDIVNWLFTDYYKPLFFEGKEDRIYRCIAIGESSLVHNGLSEGYFTITFRCNSSKLYSQIKMTDKLSVTSSDIIAINNDGHFNVYPEISILKRGTGNIIIENMSDGDSIFEIRNLSDLEDIYIDGKREIIETDAIGIYRYDDLLGLFPSLVKGVNELKITGECDIQFRYVCEYRV